MTRPDPQPSSPRDEERSDRRHDPSRGRRAVEGLAGYALVAALAALLVVQWLAAVEAGNSASRRGQRAARHVVRQGACASLTPREIDEPAPGFTLPDLAGTRRSLASLRGKAVLLHFWFTRCPPCVEELPSLLKLHRALGSRRDRVEVVTIAVDEQRADVERFLERRRLGALPVLLDPDKKVSAAYGTEKFPESYLIRPNGTVGYHFVNQRDWSTPAARACVLSALADGKP